MIFSNDQQYAKIRDLYKVKDHHIWKFEKSETSDWLDNQIYKTNDTSNNLEYNNENNINLKGFAVGNPYTNFYTGVPSGLATYWGHQLI